MSGRKKKNNTITLSDGSKLTLRRMSNWQYIKQHKWLYIMLLPGLLYFILFKYVPMGGLIIAFKEYSPFRGIVGSPWVGFGQFQRFFSTPDFWKLLRNTLGISLMQLVIYFPMPIILSLFLNEVRHTGYKRTVQTLIYIPHFVSWVIVASLSYQLFNTSDGMISTILNTVLGHKVDILANGKYFWGLIVGQDIWRETGYGTIIYLAALAGVDQEMYEAARVDGAGRWRLMWNITLPAIKGTIIMMLILRVGSLLNTGYEQIFLMRNDLNIEFADVFDTYIYTRGISNGQYSFSSAAGMFKSIVGLILVLGSNKLAKMCGEAGIY